MKQDVLEPGGTYHIFNRGNNGENIFKEEANYNYFLHLIKVHLNPVCDIYAYCLLKNHFHILLKIKEANELSIIHRQKPYLPFSNMFNAYTKAINKRYIRSGSLFQEHLKRKRVKDEKYLIQLIAYIHLNPVKHGFSEHHKNYKFSSYQAYIGRGPTDVRKDYIFSLIDRSVFQEWHDEKKLNTDYLLNTFQDQT